MCCTGTAEERGVDKWKAENLIDFDAPSGGNVMSHDILLPTVNMNPRRLYTFTKVLYRNGQLREFGYMYIPY